MSSKPPLTRADTRHYLLHARKEKKKKTLQWTDARVTAFQLVNGYV